MKARVAMLVTLCAQLALAGTTRAVDRPIGGAPVVAASFPAAGPRLGIFAAADSGDSELNQKLDVLASEIKKKNWRNAALTAVDALRFARDHHAETWILPLAAAIPGLYASAGDMSDAETYYHALIRSLLYGEIKAPPNEVEHELGYMTDAFIEHGRPADVIESVKRLVDSLQVSEGDRSIAGTELFRIEAGLYREYLLYDYSIAAAQRALEFGRKAYTPDNPRFATLLNDVGYAYLAATRFQEAEEPLKEALRIREQYDPGNLKEIGTTCQNLTTLFLTLQDLDTAEGFARRAVDARKKALGTDNFKYLESRYTLATVLYLKKEFKEAAEIFEETRAAFHKAHSVSGEAGMLEKLAFLYGDEGDLYGDKGDLAKRDQLENETVSLLETIPDDSNTPLLLSTTLEDRIDRELERGDLGRAEADATKILSALRDRVAPDHNMMIEAYATAAKVFLAKGDTEGAIGYAGRTLSGLEVQFKRLTSGAGIEGGLYAADLDLDVLFRVASTEKGREAFPFERTFEAVQWSEIGPASFALQQMAARASSVDPELQKQVRGLQDLTARRQALDIRLAHLESGLSAQRDETKIANLRQNLQNADAQISAQRTEIDRAFPRYASLVIPSPVSVGELRQLLDDNEALIKFYIPGGRYEKLAHGFVWAVTKTATRAIEIGLSARQIGDLVAALRCGLDYQAWTNQGKFRCAALLNKNPKDAPAPGDSLPFDTGISFKLYRALLGPVADLIAGKELIVVPSGSLTQLPPQVLVVDEPKPPATGDVARWRNVTWLVRKQPVSILPSIASLRALRANARPSQADRPFIGFGDPLLEGEQSDPQYGAYYKKIAAEARTWQTCPKNISIRTVLAMAPEMAKSEPRFRGRQADADELRKWAPLPETALELCEVGRQLGASAQDIYLGNRATEANLMSLSDEGKLRRYATVHFATHGFLAGDLKGVAEPGLILTPTPQSSMEPEKSARDDGLLTESEIASLSLDAKLVVMAACNTGQSAGGSAAALSGIARAFFYAGARSLLVSHWEVYSNATVKLMVDMASAKGIGRAEALRLSMLHMIDHGEPAEAHPSYWAPFVLIGEGSLR